MLSLIIIVCIGLVSIFYITTKLGGIEVYNSKTNIEPENTVINNENMKIQVGDDDIKRNELIKVFDMYNDSLDGASAEGYGSKLSQLYYTNDPRLFINVLSNYPKRKIDGMLFLFVGELFIEEKKDIIKDFEDVKTNENLSKKETYVVYEILAEFKYFDSVNQE